MDNENESEKLEVSAPETKAGIKTTEFWLVVAFTALANLGPIAQSIDGPWASIVNAVVIAVYTISRARAKSLGVALPVMMGLLFISGLSSCTVGVDPRTGSFNLSTDPAVIMQLVQRGEEKANDRLGEIILIEPSK